MIIALYGLDDNERNWTTKLKPSLNGKPQQTKPIWSSRFGQSQNNSTIKDNLRDMHSCSCSQCWLSRSNKNMENTQSSKLVGSHFINPQMSRHLHAIRDPNCVMVEPTTCSAALRNFSLGAKAHVALGTHRMCFDKSLAEVSHTIDVAFTRVAVVWAAPDWSCVVHTIEQT